MEVAMLVHRSAWQWALDKGIGWKGREKKRSLVLVSALVQLMRCPGGTAWACWGYFLIDRFPHPEGSFLAFCANYPSCAVHSFRPFWKWAVRLLGSWIVLSPLYSPYPYLSLIPVLVLSCVVLISELDQGCLSLGSAALHLHGPFSSHILFFFMAC